MRKKLTIGDIRVRILRVFTVERRWLGYYIIAAHDLMAGIKPAGCPLAEAVHDLFERGRLIGSYLDAPGQFWVYLWTALLPSPELLAASVPSQEEGGMRCHARSLN